jgi:hypothetical protein
MRAPLQTDPVVDQSTADSAADVPAAASEEMRKAFG